MIAFSTRPPDGEVCRDKIFEASGIQLEVAYAVELWEKILRHKWVLSEELGRDVGFRTACNDYMENFEVGRKMDLYSQVQIRDEMGAQKVSRETWDTISDTQPPKQLVQRRILLPLQEGGLSRKHGVTPPKTIIFFGPPGTGKTHFVKAIAGVLGWWYIEIVPSMLMEEGEDKLGATLHKVMEKVRPLEDAVIFIDEFDELATDRNIGDRIDRSVTNEFLKQVPLLKRAGKKILLICATNYIRQLDPALLRPGRFDCIIPVGTLDAEGRRAVLKYYVGKLNARNIDFDHLVRLTEKFTPADIELLSQTVAQDAFEREYRQDKDFAVTTEIIGQVIGTMRPSLTDEVIRDFQEDVTTYSRY